MPNLDDDAFVTFPEKLVRGDSVTGIITIDQLPEQKRLSKNDWLVAFIDIDKKTRKTNFASVVQLLKSDFYTKEEILTLLRNAVEYVLLPATEDTLGGVKVGTGLSIDPDGLLSADVIPVLGEDVYDVPSDIRTDVVTATYNSSNEVTSQVSNGSLPGMKFSYQNYLYEFMPGDAGTLVWIRTKKKGSTIVQIGSGGSVSPTQLTDAEKIQTVFSADIKANCLLVKPWEITTTYSIPAGSMRFIPILVEKTIEVTRLAFYLSSANPFTPNGNENYIALYKMSGATATAVLARESSGVFSDPADSGKFMSVPMFGSYTAEAGLYYIGILHNGTSTVGLGTSPAMQSSGVANGMRSFPMNPLLLTQHYSSSVDMRTTSPATQKIWAGLL